jgi:hypothetical protein
MGGEPEKIKRGAKDFQRSPCQQSSQPFGPRERVCEFLSIDAAGGWFVYDKDQQAPLVRRAIHIVDHFSRDGGSEYNHSRGWDSCTFVPYRP